MPRRSRINLTGGTNRQATFFAEEDYRAYFDWLADALALTLITLKQTLRVFAGLAYVCDLTEDEFAKP